jgi:hypothetical protein
MSESNKKISPEFVQNVKKYLELDDKTIELKNSIKELSNEKKTCEEFILNYLQTIDEKTIDIADGKLIRNVYKSQGSLKKDLIQKTLTEIVGDSIKATTITDQIIKSRPIVEKVSLKRTKKNDKTQINA